MEQRKVNIYPASIKVIRGGKKWGRGKTGQVKDCFSGFAVCHAMKKVENGWSRPWHCFLSVSCLKKQKRVGKEQAPWSCGSASSGQINGPVFGPVWSSQQPPEGRA